MSNAFVDWIFKKFSQWLLHENSPPKINLSNFDIVAKKIQMGDVILIEGRSRISTIIRHITFSRWTHATLYIGHLSDIQDSETLKRAKHYDNYQEDEQLIVESEIGYGTIISSLSNLKNYHLRILRPRGLTEEDAKKVVSYAISRLETQYDVRHIFDLLRFLLPWGIMPRRWRSSLFQHNALKPTKDICSSMIADAFQTIDYPILPIITEDYKKELELVQRNSRLYTPDDFDVSPYFDIIKYPIFPIKTAGAYHKLPWLKDVFGEDKEHLNMYGAKLDQFFQSPGFAVVGASTDRNKFGNKVLRCYVQNHKKVYPVNPNATNIEGIECMHHVSDLPKEVKSISIVTSPDITNKIVEEAITHGIQNIWMQPGAESDVAIQKCKDANVNVIADGACILNVLGFKENSI